MPSREVRNVIKVGNSLCISIPKPWAVYNKIENKSKVEVTYNGVLTIKPLTEVK